MNGDAQDPLARVLSDLADVGRKLVETSESALALLHAGEAECRPPGREPEAKDPMTPEMLTPLLTPKQVAHLLQVGTRTLARMRNDPALKFPRPIRRSRVLRWRRRDIEAWAGVER